MEKDVRVSARIPRTLKELMQQFVARNAHINESDLIRDAIREKIQREAPELYRQLFEEASSNE
ncbi:MAG: ribbon-helix-helix domain-containing protein [Candidatus Bathyarchaeia archaeon]|nr:ribbon-helix-helix domain-containing protein [Candidatus Bathyarchaeia archaeon]